MRARGRGAYIRTRAGPHPSLGRAAGGSANGMSQGCSASIESNVA